MGKGVFEANVGSEDSDCVICKYILREVNLHNIITAFIVYRCMQQYTIIQNWTLLYTYVMLGMGGAEEERKLPIYSIVLMCVPNDHLFQRCQVYG